MELSSKQICLIKTQTGTEWVVADLIANNNVNDAILNNAIDRMTSNASILIEEVVDHHSFMEPVFSKKGYATDGHSLFVADVDFSKAYQAMDSEKDFPDLLWREHEKYLKIKKNYPIHCIIRTLPIEKNAFLFSAQTLEDNGEQALPKVNVNLKSDVVRTTENRKQFDDCELVLPDHRRCHFSLDFRDDLTSPFVNFHPVNAYGQRLALEDETQIVKAFGAFEAFNDNSFAISRFLCRCCTTEKALRPTLDRLEALQVTNVSFSSEELSFKQVFPSTTQSQKTALHR